MGITSVIGEGSRIDLESSTASAMGKPVSVIAGAENLLVAMAAIAEIGSMGTLDEYSEVALSARKLLMQEIMPSIEQQKQQVLRAAKMLSAEGESQPSREVKDFLAEDGGCLLRSP